MKENRMKTRGLALWALVLGLPMVSACDDDPLSSGGGEPAFLNVSVKTTHAGGGRPVTLTAYLTDQHGARIPTQVSAASTNDAVVKVDSVRYVPEFSETHVYATAGSTFATAQIVLSARGLSDTVTVRVVPYEQPDAFDPASQDPDDPPAISVPFDEFLTVGSENLDDFFLLQVTEPITLSVELDWPGSADLDFIVWKYPSAFGAADLVNASMATGNHPERGQLTLNPGNYLLHVNNYTETTWVTYHLVITPASGESN